MTRYLLNARRDKDDNLIFKIGNKEVCCPTFLRFLGVSSSADMRDAPGQWQRLIKGFLAGDKKENLLSKKSINKDIKVYVSEKQVTTVILTFVLLKY